MLSAFPSSDGKKKSRASTSELFDRHVSTCVEWADVVKATMVMHPPSASGWPRNCLNRGPLHRQVRYLDESPRNDKGDSHLHELLKAVNLLERFGMTAGHAQGFNLTRSVAVKCSSYGIFLCGAFRLFCIAFTVASFVDPAVVWAAPVALSPPRDARDLGEDDRLVIEPALSAVVQQYINSQKRLAGQSPLISSRVYFGDNGKHVVVDLGMGYIGNVYDEVEDALWDLTNVVNGYLDGVAPVYGVDFLFDGIDLYEFFPEERGPEPGAHNSSRANLTIVDPCILCRYP